MKNNRSYQLLEQALRALPQEHEFTEARKQMKKALMEIAEVEKKKASKKASRLSPAERWTLDLETAALSSPFSQKIAGMQSLANPLDVIDKLIQKEQRKIDEIKSKQTPPRPQSGPVVGGLFNG